MKRMTDVFITLSVSSVPIRCHRTIMGKASCASAMPSPFPGMNPYLEHPELWSEFHSRMIVVTLAVSAKQHADGLDDLLSRDYWVAIEKRVYLSQNDESLLIGIPDVAVTTSRRPHHLRLWQPLLQNP
jgi:Protein of unknown function (DUF4058)